jgi:hypothetical protein
MNNATAPKDVRVKSNIDLTIRLRRAGTAEAICPSYFVKNASCAGDFAGVMVRARSPQNLQAGRPFLPVTPFVAIV